MKLTIHVDASDSPESLARDLDKAQRGIDRMIASILGKPKKRKAKRKKAK